jgi:hypothetical protein
VISFDPVVGILLGDVTRGGQQFIEHSRIPGARSVFTSVGRGLWLSAWVKNRRVAARARFSVMRTSMTWPNWSIARYR